MQINHKSDRKAISSILLLILITLEYYIRGGTYWAFGKFYVVLILIILEYYIRGSEYKPFGFASAESLNPYYTGILYTR